LLSFSAVAAIIFSGNLLYNYLKPGKGVKSKILNYITYSVGVSAGIIIFTMPFIGYYFSRVSILSILLNIIFIPGFGVIIFLVAVSIILGVIPYFPEQFLERMAELLLSLLIKISQITSEFSFSVLALSRKDTFFLTGILFIVLVFYLLKKYKVNNKKIIIPLMVFNLIFWNRFCFLGDGKLKIMFFDVGQGDACLLDFPSGKKILIDTGTRMKDYTAADFSIIPYFEKKGIRHLDKIIISHNHIDHTGGCISILERYRIDEFIESEASNYFEPVDNIHKVLNTSSIPIKRLKAGKKIILGKNKYLFILNPVFMNGKLNEDDNSLVILLVYGKNKILFTGDIGKKGESLLKIWSEILRSDVLKVPHHGSSTSSTMDFIRIVNPEYAVISVGAFNPFNHPSTDVLNRYALINSKILRTDVDGTIVFKSDGDKIERVRIP
ncbi:DNA internalization-related competence protein ComEC/Rec2, partial [candidate division KSB1 bacterium]